MKVILTSLAIENLHDCPYLLARRQTCGDSSLPIKKWLSGASRPAITSKQNYDVMVENANVSRACEGCSLSEINLSLTRNRVAGRPEQRYRRRKCRSAGLCI